MTDIRAFIGHSFLKSDADIVAKLLKHFDRISKLIPRFSWENAEAAEPKQLADKVMALIDDKNTFIGICTKREKVIESKLLSTMFLSPYVKALPEDFEWKTSDWIIQEIGMANARGLEMILLVEEGVRKPGGLQGDVEYVSFERDSPEKSFDKILEMIAALSPKSAALSTASQETKRSAEEIEKQTTLETEDKDWETPASDWDVQDYERAMFEMIANENAKGTEKINKAYLGTTNATEGDNKVIWGARKEWLQILFWKTGDMSKLKELARQNPPNSKVLVYLARGYSLYGDRIEFSGVFRGYAIEAKIVRTQGEEKPASTSLLSAEDAKPKILMILSEDRSRLRVMENPHGTTPSEYILSSLGGAAP